MFNPSMLNNMTPEQIKAQQDMMKNMSDEDLQRQMNNAKSFMPGKSRLATTVKSSLKGFCLPMQTNLLICLHLRA